MMTDNSKKDPISEAEAIKTFAEFAAACPSVHDVALWSSGAASVEWWKPYSYSPNVLAEAGLGLCGCCSSVLLPSTTKPIDAMTAWFVQNNESLVSAMKNLGDLVEHPPAATGAPLRVDLPTGLQALLSAAMTFLKEQSKVCNPHPQTSKSLDDVFGQLQVIFAQTGNHGQGGK
jgi:hypothetical protein